MESRERRIRQRFPRIGGLILALTDPPSTTTVWAQGAAGERKVAERLAKPAANERIVVLHDRRVPGSRANIDHIVAGPRGVYVIDTKRYVDKKIETRSSGTFFNPEPSRLFVGGRDRSKLVEAMAWQVAAARQAIEDLGSDHPIGIYPVLCFADGQWDLFSGPFEIDGVHVTGPRGLIKHVTRHGDLGPDERLAVGHHLAARFPEA